jgi:hypothetical protein
MCACHAVLRLTFSNALGARRATPATLGRSVASSAPSARGGGLVAPVSLPK